MRSTVARDFVASPGSRTIRGPAPRSGPTRRSTLASVIRTERPAGTCRPIRSRLSPTRTRQRPDGTRTSIVVNPRSLRQTAHGRDLRGQPGELLQAQRLQRSRWVRGPVNEADLDHEAVRPGRDRGQAHLLDLPGTAGPANVDDDGQMADGLHGRDHAQVQDGPGVGLEAADAGLAEDDPP